MTQSLGEYRVGVSFNPSGKSSVDTIKAHAAMLIDAINELPVPAVLAGDNAVPDGEIIRLKALAMTTIEEGAMWAVKAATKTPR